MYDFVRLLCTLCALYCEIFIELFCGLLAQAIGCKLTFFDMTFFWNLKIYSEYRDFIGKIAFWIHSKSSGKIRGIFLKERWSGKVKKLCFHNYEKSREIQREKGQELHIKDI